MNNSLVSQFKGRKCLVTGGAGFIGSNLSRFLKQIGSEVTIIDNFSAGNKGNISDFEYIGINVLHFAT